VSKHTSGPWSRKGNSVVDSEGSPVLRGTTFQDEETRANLDLAAAAPDMLHALMAVEEMLANPEPMPEVTRNELLKGVRAALRRAK
jgi:hypothetical protein